MATENEKTGIVELSISILIDIEPTSREKDSAFRRHLPHSRLQEPLTLDLPNLPLATCNPMLLLTTVASGLIRCHHHNQRHGTRNRSN